MNGLWVKRDCAVGRIYTCAVAQLRLWVERNAQGWLAAARHEQEPRFEAWRACESLPEQAEWQRFVTPSSATCVRLAPTLPDRSVASRPGARIEIAPKHKGRFFVTIPVWVRLEAEPQDGARPVRLAEFATRVLAKTWVGHPAEEGEVGYALTTRARQGEEELTDVEGRAICPVLLDNATDEALTFAQLALSVRHMSVYEAEDGKLWTNECRLGYTGHVFPESLAFGHEAPEQARGSRLITGPREAPTSGLTARAIAGVILRQQL